MCCALCVVLCVVCCVLCVVCCVLRVVCCVLCVVCCVLCIVYCVLCVVWTRVRVRVEVCVMVWCTFASVMCIIVFTSFLGYSSLEGYWSLYCDHGLHHGDEVRNVKTTAV